MIVTVHTVICDICGAKKKMRPIRCLIGDTAERAFLPAMWKKFESVIVCPKHKISIHDIVEGSDAVSRA